MLAGPVKDDAVRAADPVVAVVAGGLLLERVLDELGRRKVGQARLFSRIHGLLLGNDCKAAVLHKACAREGRVDLQGEDPARRIPDAAERLELRLDGEGLAGHNERLSRLGEKEREHLLGLVGVDCVGGVITLRRLGHSIFLFHRYEP